MTRHSDYQAAVEAGGYTLAPPRIELTTFDGEVLATNRSGLLTGDMILWKVTPGNLEFSSGTVSQRSLTLAVVADDERLIPFPGSALHPDSQSRVRVYGGILLPDGTELSRPMATMLVDEAEGTEYRGTVAVTLDLVDLLHPVRSDLEHSFNLVGGEPVSAAVERLLAQVLPQDSFMVEDLGWTIPSDNTLAPGTNRMTTVTQLLMGCGQELVASEEGLVYSREIISSDDDPNMERWVYGPNGIPVEKTQRTWFSRTAQAWKIEGGNFTSGSSGQTIVVYDRDQRSEGYWRPSATHRHIGSTRLPWVGGVRQAAVAGYGQIRANSSGPGLVTITAPPNPFLKEGDLIELDSGTLRATGLYRVVGFTYVYGAALMTITARGVFDPSVGYEFPIDRAEGCMLSASDGFDRGPGPLDNPGAASGLDWVTFGRGWRIDDAGAAEQTVDGWQAAVLNTPMCALDHTASAEIYGIPLDGEVGVMVRSSGEWDGYAATVDSYGMIRLTVWLAGQIVGTLAEVQSQGTPSTRTLALTAVGSALAVEYGPDVVINATDDRRTGGHVGIIGKNAYGQSGPTLNQFNASEAT